MNDFPRNRDYNIIPNAITRFSKETVLDLYQKMAYSRAFENCIVRAVQKNGKGFQIKIHMSSGQESVSAALATAVPDYQFFIQHRSMDMLLALGARPEEIRDEILCLDSGCCGGKLGGAFQLHRDGRDVFAHTGFIGENISVGVGAALGNARRTVCLFGDGAAEEDYALTSYGFAATHNLPVLFVCTDNDLSVLSPSKKRRSWSLADVAEGCGVKAFDMTDDPFSILYCLNEIRDELPALINVRVCRNYWHAGIGIDHAPEWNRYEIVREQIKELGWGAEVSKIDKDAASRMEEVWEKYL